MQNKRMAQVIFMFSEITGKSEEESEQIINITNVGKAIRENDPIVLYEQQTENLYSIAMELHQSEQYKDIADMLSNEAIVRTMKQLEEGEKWRLKEIPLSYHSNKTQKEKKKQQDKIHMKNSLRIKQQNKINLGRM